MYNEWMSCGDCTEGSLCADKYLVSQILDDYKIIMIRERTYWSHFTESSIYHIFWHSTKWKMYGSNWFVNQEEIKKNKFFCAISMLTVPYSQRIISTPWLMESYLIALPGHWQLGYELCWMRIIVSTLKLNTSMMCHFRGAESERI